MCIVTYTPINEGFIFTSSRDESMHRPTKNPDIHLHGAQQLCYAKDLQKGGTWFAIAVKEQKLSCLLNAAQGDTSYQNPKSRGMLPLFELLSSTEITVGKTMPCVLITFNFDAPLFLKETHWKGDLRTVSVKDVATSYLWASDNLYEEHDIKTFKEKWATLKKNKSIEDVKAFHDACAQPLNSDIYKRKNADVMTVSTTTMIKNNRRFEVHHQNRVTNTNLVIDLNSI